MDAVLDIGVCAVKEEDGGGIGNKIGGIGRVYITSFVGSGIYIGMVGAG